MKLKEIINFIYCRLFYSHKIIIHNCYFRFDLGSKVKIKNTVFTVLSISNLNNIYTIELIEPKYLLIK